MYNVWNVSDSPKQKLISAFSNSEIHMIGVKREEKHPIDIVGISDVFYMYLHKYTYILPEYCT